MITIIKNGKFTGTQYSDEQFTKDVQDFHTGQDETWIDKPRFEIEANEKGEIDFGEPTSEELIQAKKLIFTSAINKLIQNEVDKYNLANGTGFERVHNCTAYKDIETYPHRQFCINVLNWNASVWETARKIELDVSTGTRPMPTLEELLAELPAFEV